MDTLEKTRIVIWCMAIYVPFRDKLVILGPIDFLFGLPVNLIVNVWQNKSEVDILKKCGQNSQLKAQNRTETTFDFL